MTRVLNRGNRELIVSTLDCLALSEQTRLLDVGFGGGLALQLAHARGVTQLFGVDPSEAAIERLKRTRTRWETGGNLTLKQASVKCLPFETGSMDAVLSTNTVYFWPDLAGAFAELRRVLVSEGTLALGFTCSEKLRSFTSITRNGFLFHETENITAHARSAGFANVGLVTLHGAQTEGDFVLVATA